MPGGTTTRIELADGGRLRLTEGWLNPAQSADTFARLMQEVCWKQEHFMMGARRVMQPRLSSWIGDPGTHYRYSGRSFAPAPWTPTSSELRAQLSAEEGPGFNSVLANLYRDGSDSMGSHADDEPELGVDPVIASLSLGGTRRLVFRHRKGEAEKVELVLTDGSLLWMEGSTQRFWRHEIRKTRRPVQPRINLTYRRVQGPGTP